MVPFKATCSDQEGIGPGATGQPCRFGVNKGKCAQLVLRKMRLARPLRYGSY